MRVNCCPVLFLVILCRNTQIPMYRIWPEHQRIRIPISPPWQGLRVAVIPGDQFPVKYKTPSKRSKCVDGAVKLWTTRSEVKGHPGTDNIKTLTEVCTSLFSLIEWPKLEDWNSPFVVNRVGRLLRLILDSFTWIGNYSFTCKQVEGLWGAGRGRKGAIRAKVHMSIRYLCTGELQIEY